MNRYRFGVICLCVLSLCVSNQCIPVNTPSRPSYVRQEGCTLDELRINGNVKRVEVVSLTTVPLTELIAEAYNMEEVLPVLFGNFSMDFDNTGNVIDVCGFGVNGDTMFQVTDFQRSEPTEILPAFFGAKKIELFDKLKVIRDDKGYVNEIKYFNGVDPVWIAKMKYNDSGDVVAITKKYCKPSEKFPGLLNFVDTTMINYQQYDEWGNWTNAEVEYKGVRKEHNFKYEIVRSIAYDMEESPISLLKDYQQSLKSTQEPEKCEYVTESTPFFTIEVPDFMTKLSSSEIADALSVVSADDLKQSKYLFMYGYRGNDSYSHLSALISQSNGENIDYLTGTELIYDETTDRELEESFSNNMARNGYVVLKWLPYKYIKVGGKKCLKVSYYRYGIGSPIPVYVEVYTMSVDDDYNVSFTISYESKDFYRFRDCFEYTKQSIHFVE